ncbi:UNVERIFIED_CONTAM: hypothetical protein FKN15_014716 [Acipenser sinensis]
MDWGSSGPGLVTPALEQQVEAMLTPEEIAGGGGIDTAANQQVLESSSLANGFQIDVQLQTLFPLMSVRLLKLPRAYPTAQIPPISWTGDSFSSCFFEKEQEEEKERQRMMRKTVKTASYVGSSPRKVIVQYEKFTNHTKLVFV